MRDTAFHQISPRSIFFFQPGGMFPPRFIVVRTYPQMCHAGMRFQKGLNGQHRKAVQAREAAAKAAREKAARQAKTGGSMLGGRKHAGPILILLILVLLAIFVLPRVL